VNVALPPLNTIALCAGVGGLDLGVSLAIPHARTVCYVEREAAAAASLAASIAAGWFHPAAVWSDMRTFDGAAWRGCVDLVTSGDPCQGNSVAGKRLGQLDDRWLLDRAIEIFAASGARYFFRENVPGNAAGQLAVAIPALERLGCRVASGIFSSAETGNTMRRERLFILAVRGVAQPGQSGRGNHAGPADRRAGQSVDARAAGLRSGNWPHVPDRSGTAIADGGDQLGSPASPRSGRSEQSAPDAGNVDVGSPQSLGPGTCRPEHARQQGGYSPASAGGELARPASAGPQGRQTVGHARSQRAPFERGGRTLPPAIIPGPSDSRWIDLLDRFPEYQPALGQEEAESHLRRGIDAMAHRIERLRATGNGVDPITAAYAFLRLRERLSQ